MSYNFFEAARPYAEAGLRCFPCCDDKKPLVAGGLNSATCDPGQLEAWAQRWPLAFLGVATDRIVVIDIDPLPDGPNTWPPSESEIARALMTGPANKTSRGRHFWFRQPDGMELRNTTGRISSNVDTRATGGYVIVPPSGGRRWIEGMEFVSVDAMPVIPDCLLRLLAEQPRTESVAAVTTSKNVIPQGKRDDTIYRIGCKLAGDGFSEDEIRAMLAQVNANRCKPPLSQAEIATKAKQAAKFAPNENGVMAASGKAALLVCFDQIKAEQVKWTWKGRIPAGKMSLLFGDPGLGKSFAAFDWAARISCGRAWPDGAPNEVGSVIILSAEDDAADTIAPRLINAGANMSNIFCLQGVHFGDPTKPQTFSLESDLPALEDAIAKTTDCRLVIIDPISAFTGRTDTHKNSEVRSLLTPLRDVAERTGAAVLLISHLNKAGGQSALHRASGSIGIIAACRAGLLAAKDKDDSARRLLLPAKNNLGPEIGGLAYRIIDPGLVEWEVTPITMTADEALDQTPEQPQSEKRDAAAWLQELLKPGAMPAKDVEAQADEAGFSWHTIKRAKTAAGIVAHREGGTKGRWVWILPGATLLAKEVKRDAAPLALSP